MLGYILLSLYGIYCCVFCTAIIYTECQERQQRRQQIRRQYEVILGEEPQIDMILESEYSKKFNRENTLAPIIEEDEVEKVFDRV